MASSISQAGILILSFGVAVWLITWAWHYWHPDSDEVVAPNLSALPQGAAGRGMSSSVIAPATDGLARRLVILRYEITNHSEDSSVALRLFAVALDQSGWAFDGPLRMTDARRSGRGHTARSLLDDLQQKGEHIWEEVEHLEPRESRDVAMLFLMSPLDDGASSDDRFMRALGNAELKMVEAAAQWSVTFSASGGYRRP